MYRHILVPLDGSELAEQVLPHVEALAGKFGSAITLLRATPIPDIAAVPAPLGMPMTPPMTPYSGEMYGEAIEAEQRQAHEYLTVLVERLGGAGIRVEMEVVDGDAVDTIVERATALGVELIAMTTHGRTGLERLLLGSVAEEVIRRAPCALLLVRVGERRPEQTEKG
jgi:nucleotide-binding universal stress UspA family protein